MKVLLKTQVLVALLTYLVLAPSAFTCNVTSEEAALDRHIQDLKIKRANVHLALSYLANNYRVPIGFEVASGGNEGPEIHLDFQDTTLREVLNTVVAEDVRYEWTVRNGVINVTPKSER